MQNESFPHSPESAPQYPVIPPSVEMLFDPENPSSPWPESVRNNETLRQQAETRETLHTELAALYEHLPNAEMDARDGIASGLIDAHMLATTYESLSHFFEQDDANRRAALYLPFELLPTTSTDGSAQLRQASERFASIYTKSWRELLSEHDVRANFVDGDIPEPELRTAPLPRVVKAAHLIPKLVEKKMLSVSDVLDILKDSTDDTLTDSIIDTLPVLNDLELLTAEDYKAMEQSSDPLVAGLARDWRTEQHREQAAEKMTTSATELMDLLDASIESMSTQTIAQQGGTALRDRWLASETTRIQIDAYARKMSILLQNGAMSAQELAAYLGHERPLSHTLTAIEAARGAVEAAAQGDGHTASKTFETYRGFFDSAWTIEDSEVRDELESAYYRLYNTHAIDAETLAQKGLMPPTLGVPFSERTHETENDTHTMEEVAARIEQDPVLSNYLYPVALTFGSRIKGYAKKSADLDVAIFVRPGISFEKRQELQAHIKEIFSHERVGGKALEFWLKESGKELSIQDFENPDNALGDSTLAHVLFNGAWCGNTDAIKELHERVLAGYLYSKDKTVLGKDARGVWLSEMERDMLQYRLMHKGYARFFPQQGGIHTPHADAIDGESMFYDSGYRRLATQLYLQNVFLPQLEK